MTIAVDWDLKPQPKQTHLACYGLFTLCELLISSPCSGEISLLFGIPKDDEKQCGS